MQLIQSNFLSKVSPARQRQLALLLTALLAVVALWWLAQLTWRVLTPADTVVIPPNNQVSRTSAPQIRVGALQALNLFGDRAAQETTTETALNAPETTLNVRLVGLVASSRQERSAAIIEQGGSQRTYIVGEQIGNSRARVEQILPDRVLLDNGGRREVLYIEGRDGSEAQLRMPSVAPTTSRSSAREAAEPVRIDAQDNPDVAAAVASVRDNPSAILEIINIAPLREGQQVVGYRLQPRENTELFAALGLQSGDVAVAINGFDLSDPAQALAAINELQDASRAIIQVRRDNELVDLELQVP